jgi:peroxiredoxin Q/BCP
MTEPLQAGAQAPAFTFPSSDGDVTLSTLLGEGRRVVLAFFHEAGTPTCVTQIAMLKDTHEMISEFGGAIIAVSADTPDAQRRFAESLGGVPFPLASDVNLTAARAYGVVHEGEPRRSRRAVFVIDRDGTLVYVNSHFQPGNLSQVEAILAALTAE